MRPGRSRSGPQAGAALLSPGPVATAGHEAGGADAGRRGTGAGDVAGGSWEQHDAVRAQRGIRRVRRSVVPVDVRVHHRHDADVDVKLP